MEIPSQTARPREWPPVQALQQEWVFSWRSCDTEEFKPTTGNARAFSFPRAQKTDAHGKAGCSVKDLL
ncbi:MAG: hypothetical protein AAGC86_16545, partial [Pseudomonadota bacterium]